MSFAGGSKNLEDLFQEHGLGVDVISKLKEQDLWDKKSLQQITDDEIKEITGTIGKGHRLQTIRQTLIGPSGKGNDIELDELLVLSQKHGLGDDVISKLKEEDMWDRHILQEITDDEIMQIAGTIGNKKKLQQVRRELSESSIKPHATESCITEKPQIMQPFLEVIESMEKAAVVEVDEEQYSLMKVPSSGSKLVLKAKGELVGVIDLQTVVDDLDRMGLFLEVAYNGVAGHTELQIKVKEFGYTTADLCSKSALIAHSFATTSGTVLRALKTTYSYLLEGQEEMGIYSLGQCCQLSRKMADFALEMKAEFEKAGNTAKDIENDVRRKKGVEEENYKKTREQQEQTTHKLEIQKQMEKELNEEMQKADADFKDAKKREMKVAEDGASVTMQIVSVATQTISGIKHTGLKLISKIIESFEENVRKAEAARDNDIRQSIQLEKKRAEERRTDILEKKIKVLEDMAAITQDIATCGNKANLEKSAADALHGAVGALTEMALVMAQAAEFWKQMELYCDNLTGEAVHNQVKEIMKKSEAQRFKLWRGQAFKEQGIRYYSQWVAIENVSRDYTERLKSKRADLHAILKRNPTTQQALESVAGLAQKLNDQIEQDKRKIQSQLSRTH